MLILTLQGRKLDIRIQEISLQRTRADLIGQGWCKRQYGDRISHPVDKPVGRTFLQEHDGLTRDFRSLKETGKIGTEIKSSVS